MKTMGALLAVTLIVASLAVANYVAWLRLHPEVSAVEFINEKAKYHAHVVMLHQRAMERVDPGTRESYLPVYDAQNPGLFLLVTELAIRAGLTTPLPLEVLSIVLFNIGALCFFFWVYLLFSDILAATFATVFLVLSQFFLFFPGITHTMPYEFVFFNLMLLLFVLYLKCDERVYLAAALVAMFLTAMNYWFYYMSSWIVMVGLWWQYRGRPRLRDVALISVPLVAAATLTAGMIVYIVGGFTGGILRMLDLFVARTIDARMPNSHWYPNFKFVSAADWWRYPDIVASRLEWAYSFDLKSASIAAVVTLVLLSIRKRSSAVSALILLLGSLSWYYVMFQHTIIHSFTGIYSFLGICPLLGLIVAEAIVSVAGALNSIRACFAGGAISRAVLSTSVAGLMVVVTWSAVVPFYRNSRTLIKNTVAIAADVEKKYQLAVEDACRDDSTVTLEKLKVAAQTWGFQWTPEILADTHQMPTCSRYMR